MILSRADILALPFGSEEDDDEETEEEENREEEEAIDTAAAGFTSTHRAGSGKVRYMYDVEDGEFLGDAMDEEASVDGREKGFISLEESHVVSEEDEVDDVGDYQERVDQSPSLDTEALVRCSIAVSTAASQHPVVDTAIEGGPPIILVRLMAVPTEDDFQSNEEFARLRGECSSSSSHPKMIVARILAEDQQGQVMQRRIWGNNAMLARITTSKVLPPCAEYIRSGDESEDNEVPIELSESVRSSLPQAQQRDL